MAILLIPSVAFADVMMPSVVVATGLIYGWYLIFIIIFIEWVVLKLILKLKAIRTLLYSTIMNVVSTAVGIPLMYMFDLSILYSVHHISDAKVFESDIGSMLLNVSIIILYVLVLLFLSVYFEYLCLRLIKAPKKNLKKAVIYANISSYSFFLLIAVGLWGIANIM